MTVQADLTSFLDAPEQNLSFLAMLVGPLYPILHIVNERLVNLLNIFHACTNYRLPEHQHDCVLPWLLQLHKEIENVIPSFWAFLPLFHPVCNCSFL